MLTKRLILLFFILLTSFAASAQETADLILHNGTIWTVDDKNPRAEAVAIGKEKILSVGANDAVLKLKGNQTKVIDLKNAFVVPGFNDNHVHFASAAQFLEFNIMKVTTQSEFVSRVKELIKKLQPGEWITGGYWGAYDQWIAGSSGGEQRERFTPDFSTVSEISRNHPIFIRRFDDSEFGANEAALRAADLDPAKPNKDGIEFVRDSAGRFTGIMKGKAALKLFESIFPKKLSFQRRLDQTKQALAEIAKYGVTNISDMSDDDQLDEKLPEKKAPIEDLPTSGQTLKEKLAENIKKGSEGSNILVENSPVQAGPADKSYAGPQPPAKKLDQDLRTALKYSDEKSRFHNVKEEFQKLDPSEAKQILGRIKTHNPKDPVSKEFHAGFKKAEADQLKDVLIARYNPDSLVPANLRPAQKAKPAEPKTPAEMVKVLADSKQPFNKPGNELTWKEKQAMDGYLSKTNSDEFKKILQDSKNWSLDAQINLYSVVGDNDKLAGRIVKEFKGNDLVEISGQTLQFYKGSNNFRAAIIEQADLSEMPGLINTGLGFGNEIMRHRRGGQIVDSVDKRSKENLMTGVLATIGSNQTPTFLEGENFFKAVNSLTGPERGAFFQNLANRGILTQQVLHGIDMMAKQQKMMNDYIKLREEQLRKQMEEMTKDIMR